MQRRDFLKWTGAAIVVSVAQPVSAQEKTESVASDDVAFAEPVRAPIETIEKNDSGDVNYAEGISNGRFCTFCTDVTWDAFDPF